MRGFHGGEFMGTFAFGAVGVEEWAGLLSLDTIFGGFGFGDWGGFISGLGVHLVYVEVGLHWRGVHLIHGIISAKISG
jgi:hypothetical protein